jgi:hypothetical protein
MFLLRRLHNKISTFSLVFMAVAGSSYAVGESAIPFLDASLSEQPGNLVELQDAPSSSQQIVLSTPKRISNRLVIKKQEKIEAPRQSALYQFSDTNELELFTESLQSRLELNGSLSYACASRACGASNDWANKVWGVPSLSGRDSNQAYFAGFIDKTSVNTAQSGWLSVYSVLNGRRKALAYVSFVPSAERRSPVFSSLVFALESKFTQGIQALADELNRDDAKQLYVLAYYEDASQAKSLTEAKAHESQLLAWLEGQGEIPKEKVTVIKLGSLGHRPAVISGPAWFEAFLR